ncbi:MAG TPA: hypothetical protein DIU15_03920 [Deltaproteobacteria bacterium]|nr:hypothetical protein [Deltaproteobacteria bacterium]
MEAACDFCNRRQWKLTLLTPYVTDWGLEKIDPLLQALDTMAPHGTEVVVNDWGVLRQVANRSNADLLVVLGRGLNRMFRDPRVPDVGPEHLGGDAPPSAWRSASHQSQGFRTMLRSAGIQRIETDMPMQGMQDLDPDEQDLKLSVHLPYGMVASGRICMMSALGQSASVRFTPPRACTAPCHDYTLELRAPWTRRAVGAGRLPLVAEDSFLPLDHVLNRRRNAFPAHENDDAPRFIQKGNTHFYCLDEEKVDSALDWVHRNPTADRIVVAPDVPM